MSQLTVEVLGEPIGVSAPTSERPRLEAALADLAAPPGTTASRQLELVDRSDGATLFDGDRAVCTGIAPGLATATLVWWLNTVVAARRQVVIHAASVAAPGGVIVAGTSGAGKSTLAAACIREGVDYLSDEFAVVDIDHGHLLPYPKPIGLDREELLAATTLRPGSISPPCRPAGIVFPRFERDAEFSTTEVSAPWTLIALASHTTNLTSHGAVILPWLVTLATSCPAVQVTHGDAVEVVELVRTLAARPTAPTRPAPTLGPITADTTTVEMGDHLAVFHEPTKRVHVLTQSAAFAWISAVDAIDPVGRADVVLADAPPGAFDRPTVVATIDQLVAVGLLDAAGDR